MLYYEDGYVYDTADCTSQKVSKADLQMAFNAGVSILGIDSDFNTYDWRQAYRLKLSSVTGVKFDFGSTLCDSVDDTFVVSGNFGVLDSAVLSKRFSDSFFITLKGNGVLRLSPLSIGNNISRFSYINLANTGIQVDITSSPELNKYNWVDVLKFSYKKWLLASYFTDYIKAPLLADKSVFVDKFAIAIAENSLVYDLPFSDIGTLLNILKPYTDKVVNSHRDCFDVVLGVGFDVVNSGKTYYSEALKHKRNQTTGKYILSDVYKAISFPEMAIVLNILNWFSHDNELIAKTYDHLCSYLK